MCLIKDAFLGEKNFDVIKMHGTTIKISIYIFPSFSVFYTELVFWLVKVDISKVKYVCKICNKNVLPICFLEIRPDDG